MFSQNNQKKPQINGVFSLHILPINRHQGLKARQW
jgi:hypothetical protein